MPKLSTLVMTASDTSRPGMALATIAMVELWWSSFMWEAMCIPNWEMGSGLASVYSSGVTDPARANPPTNRILCSSSMRNQLKSPKLTQKAPGCFFKYNALAASISSGSFIRATFPIRLTRPSAAPLNSLDAIVTEHFGSAKISCVCVDMPEKTKMGLPSSSGANPTTEPPGKPGSVLELVDMTANPWLYSTRVRMSTAHPILGAFCWCSPKRC
mmetsp:Transcript_12979/g.23510  ORF Transcript_12979/g.23510 Transcript_12979/m.23510 type:complete len:214 (-) Transcript_12979:413-1054(-)